MTMRSSVKVQESEVNQLNRILAMLVNLPSEIQGLKKENKMKIKK